MRGLPGHMLFGRARSFAHKTFACCSTERLIKHRKQMPYIFKTFQNMFDTNVTMCVIMFTPMSHA
jgi:hypothetical protein